MLSTAGYTAMVRGTNAYGSPVWRVCTDSLQILYVTVPYKRSSAVEVDETISRALAALRRPPKPIGRL